MAHITRQGWPPQGANNNVTQAIPFACLHWSCSSWGGALKQEVQGDSGKRKDLDMAASVQGQAPASSKHLDPPLFPGPHSRGLTGTRQAVKIQRPGHPHTRVLFSWPLVPFARPEA